MKKKDKTELNKESHTDEYLNLVDDKELDDLLYRVVLKKPPQTSSAKSVKSSDSSEEHKKRHQ